MTTLSPLLLAASLHMLFANSSPTTAPSNKPPSKKPNVTFLDLMQPAVDVDSQPSDTGDKAWCDHTAPATGNTWCCGFAIPSLLVTGNGTILALAEGRKFGCGDCSGQHDLICKRSTDNGASWQPCASPAGKGIAVVELGTWRRGGGWAVGHQGAAVWDPSPVEDRQTGTIFIHFGFTPYPNVYVDGDCVQLSPWLQENWVMNSTDNGASFGEPVNITGQLARSQPAAGWCGHRAGGAPGVQAASGRLILSGYHADCMGVDPMVPSPLPTGWSNEASHTIYSDDHGYSWRSTDAQLYLAVGQHDHLQASFLTGLHCSPRRCVP